MLCIQPMKAIKQDDPVIDIAESFVNQTSCNVFLTGKAGSGKTTFLHRIVKHSSKNFVVAAPTGVAAINAGGMTIHSFFQLPVGIFIPEKWTTGFQNYSQAVYSRDALLQRIRINKQKRKLIRELELLIIDEVSMVRADVMDAVDMVLKSIRKNYKKAFGGVQVLMIGDMNQLPPVVPEPEKPLLQTYYTNPYFFSSRVIQNSPPVYLELDKIYRQMDKNFIDLLNKIRHNQLSEDDLAWLNTFYKPGFKPLQSEKYITLCSHHYKANAINDTELRNLPGELFQFEAEIEGDFNQSASPADQMLFLKKGAQIMFIKNDPGEIKRYFNGKIGLIDEIDKEGIVVSFPGEKEKLPLEKELWKNIRYSYDETSGSISEKILGTFHQYPIRLAWAITIHKSQGLTFDRAIIDAGDSFTSGQVYVALSRLRDTKGLVLRTPIERRSIISDWQVQFEDKSMDKEELIDFLRVEQKKFLQRILLKSMDWDPILFAFKEFIEEYREKQASIREETLQLGITCLNKAKELREVAFKFQTQLRKLFTEGESAYPLLAGRLEAASEYFSKHLTEWIQVPLDNHYEQIKGKTRIRKYLKTLQGLRQAVAHRFQDIKQARDLAVGLAKGENVSGLIEVLNDNRKKFTAASKISEKPEKQKKGDSRNMSLKLYREGKSVDQIARERMLQPSTIESHLLHFIREGDLQVFSLISEEKYGKLYPRLMKMTGQSVSEIKYEMGDQFTYTEIRAVINHLAYLKKRQVNIGN